METAVAAIDGGWVSHLEQALTLEVALYLAAIVLAAALRLLFLDLRPLSVEEGALALDAHLLSQGRPIEALQQGPFVVFGTALAMFTFGGGDAAARLLPALFGTALVATPYLLRDALGRVPALLAAYAMAVSPLLVFASRDVGGGMVPLALGLLLWCALDQGLKDAGRARAYAAAALAGALLASGTEGATLLVTLALAALISHPQPARLVAGLRDASSSPVWRRAALVFVASALALGTGLGTRPSGVQSVAVDVWANWLGSFSLSARRGNLVVLLALYELPVLVFGLAQLFRTMFRRHRTDMFLSLWSVLLLLSCMMQETSSPSRVVLPVLPLYLLFARLASDSLGLARWVGRGWGWTTASTAVAVPAAVAIILLNRASSGADIPTPFLYGEGALLIAGAIAVAFLLNGREKVALAWCAAAILSVGFLIHATAFLNYRLETLPSEPIVGSQVSTSLRDASLDAAYFAAYYNAPVTVDPELRSATRWYLREARSVQYSTEAPDGISIMLVRGARPEMGKGFERRPALYTPGVDVRAFSWRSAWGWLAMRDGLVRANQRDIIVRAPAGNW